jgi:hypothetical protein
MTRKIIASVVHSATLTVEERAALLADPVVRPGFVRMTVVNPAEHGEAWCGWGAGQRSLFRQDTDGGLIYVIVPRDQVGPLSRAGYALQQ